MILIRINACVINYPEGHVFRFMRRL